MPDMRGPAQMGAREDPARGGVSASGQKELTVPGDHRAAAVVLQGDDANVGDAAPVLEDVGAGSGRKRARGAQVVDAGRDRLRHAFAAALVEETQQRRQLEEGAENATVHGGKRGVADDLVPERQHALEDAIAAFHLDAEEARVRDGVDDLVHRPPPCLERTRRSNELSLRLAPSMNVPRALAKGSLAVRSQATARTKATLRVSR